MNEFINKYFSGESSENENRLPSYANQNFLIDFLSEFKRIKGTSIDQSFENFIIMEPKQQSSLFLNDLTKISKGQSLLENVPRSLLGDLQPYFELYLTEGMKKGTYKQVKLLLNNAKDKDKTPFDDITRDRKGLRVGFRSFSWDYLGSHPGDIDYHINCALNLYFESPQALFHEYTTLSNEKYGFYNLIYRRGPADKGSKFAPENSLGAPGNKHTHETSLDYHQKDFRIKIEIGYKPPKLERVLDAFIDQGLSGNGAIQAAKDFREALMANKVELFLTLVKHTFEPNFSSTDFGFEMKIEFVGSIEQAFTSDDANILIRKNSEFEKKLKELEDKAQKIRKNKLERASLSRDALAAVEELDLDIIKAEISARDEEPSTGTIRDQISTSLNDILSTNEVPEKKLKFEPGQMESVYDYLKATSDVNHYEDKLLLSPVNKYDIYRRVMCEMNEMGRIYNLQTPSAEFTDYINKRGKIKSGIILNERQRLSYRKLLKTASDAEKKRIKKILRDSKLGVINKQSTFSNFKEKFLNNETGKVRTKLSDKEIAEAMVLKQNRAIVGLLNPNIDQEEYAKYIKVEATKADASDKTKKDENHHLYWFYYGDLLDSMINTIRKNKELDLDIWSNTGNKNGLLKIILGNIEYVDHLTGNRDLVNISKVPISLDLWEEFWHKFVISDFKEIYYFKSFLRDSFVHLVQASLTNRSRLPGDAVISMFPGIDYMDISTKEFNSKFTIRGGHDASLKDIHSSYLKRINTGATPAGAYDDEDNASAEDTQRILYMFDVSNKPGYLIGKDKAKDNEHGIYHLIPGRYNTPIQQISFTKTDQPLWLEAKAYNSDYLRKNVHYSEPYNCNFTIFGNTLIRPGRHIYIRFPYAWFGSPALEGSESRALGLGGYFLMTKTSNRVILSPGGGRLEWDTTAQALWTTFGGTTKPIPSLAEEVIENPTESDDAATPTTATVPSDSPTTFTKSQYGSDLNPAQAAALESVYKKVSYLGDLPTPPGKT